MRLTGSSLNHCSCSALTNCRYRTPNSAPSKDPGAFRTAGRYRLARPAARSAAVLAAVRRQSDGPSPKRRVDACLNPFKAHPDENGRKRRRNPPTAQTPELAPETDSEIRRDRFTSNDLGSNPTGWTLGTGHRYWPSLRSHSSSPLHPAAGRDAKLNQRGEQERGVVHVPARARPAGAEK